MADETSATHEVPESGTSSDLETLREKIAEALALQLNGPASDGRGWYRTDAERMDCLRNADAVLAVVQPKLDLLRGYENALNWMTTCLSCSRVLDASIREHERAEQAEGELARLRAGADPTPRAPGVMPTAGQWIHHWNQLPAEHRLPYAQDVLARFDEASRCFQLDHDGLPWLLDVAHQRVQALLIRVDRVRRLAEGWAGVAESEGDPGTARSLASELLAEKGRALLAILDQPAKEGQ